MRTGAIITLIIGIVIVVCAILALLGLVIVIRFIYKLFKQIDDDFRDEV